MPTTRRTTLGDRAFPVAAAWAWNALPASVRKLCVQATDENDARNECLTTLSLTVFTKRNFVADFLPTKCDVRQKTAVLRFWAPPPPFFWGGGLRATHGDHLRLIGMRVVNFILTLIEFLFRSVLRLRRYEQLSVQNRRFCSNRETVDPKFQVQGVDQPFFFSVNYAKWSFVWYKNLDRSCYRFVTIHACGRRTDRRTAFSSLHRVCISRSAVKTKCYKNVGRTLFRFVTIHEFDGQTDERLSRGLCVLEIAFAFHAYCVGLNSFGLSKLIAFHTQSCAIAHA